MSEELSFLKERQAGETEELDEARRQKEAEVDEERDLLISKIS